MSDHQSPADVVARAVEAASKTVDPDILMLVGLIAMQTGAEIMRLEQRVAALEALQTPQEGHSGASPAPQAPK